MSSGDILVADRGFWSFANLALLPMRGADLPIGSQRQQGAEQAHVEDGPNLTVRQIRARATRRGFRSEELFLVTTLLDVNEWPKETIVGLYLRRW